MIVREHYDDCNMEYCKLFTLTPNEMGRIIEAVERAIVEFIQYTNSCRDDIEIVMGTTVWSNFKYWANVEFSVPYPLSKPYEKAWFDSVEVTHDKYCNRDGFIIRKKRSQDYYTSRISLVREFFNKDKMEEELMLKKLQIKKVIYNEPATIVYWEDGGKTVVKVQEGEPFDKEKGLAMAMCKRMNDDKGNYNDIFKKWCE